MIVLDYDKIGLYNTYKDKNNNTYYAEKDGQFYIVHFKENLFVLGETTVKDTNDLIKIAI